MVVASKSNIKNVKPAWFKNSFLGRGGHVWFLVYCVINLYLWLEIALYLIGIFTLIKFNPWPKLDTQRLPTHENSTMLFNFTISRFYHEHGIYDLRDPDVEEILHQLTNKTIPVEGRNDELVSIVEQFDPNYLNWWFDNKYFLLSTNDWGLIVITLTNFIVGLIWSVVTFLKRSEFWTDNTPAPNKNSWSYVTSRNKYNLWFYQLRIPLNFLINWYMAKLFRQANLIFLYQRTYDILFMIKAGMEK